MSAENYNLRPKPKIVQEDSSDSSDEASVVEESTNKNSRGRNWDWESSYEMLRVLHKEGKNWSKVLNILHSRHLVTDISDPSKLRTRYNTLNGKTSPLKKDFSASKFSPSRKNLPKEEIRAQELEHARQTEKLRQEHEHARTLIAGIEAREALPGTNDAPLTETAVKADIEKKAEDRRSVRNNRFEQYMKDAEHEKEFRQQMLGSLKNIFDLLRESIQQERELMAEKQPNKKRKLNNN